MPIEKDLVKANRNCRRPERAAEKRGYDAEAHVGMNERYHKVYEYPEGVAVRPMWPFEGDRAGESS